MKKYLGLILLVGMLFTLAACSGSEESNDEQNEDSMKWVDVKLTISPEKPQPNEPVLFKAAVTYGDEVVTDAKDVSFEIWRANDEKHEEVAVKQATDGAYQLEKSFERDGTYYVIAHVTAKSMHSMPKKEFVIGTPSEPEKKNEKSQYMEEHDSMEATESN